MADHYDKPYLIEAQYVDDRKVAGLRSCHDAKLRLKILRGYFGTRRIREITHADLEKFKITRLNLKAHRGSSALLPRSTGSWDY